MGWITSLLSQGGQAVGTLAKGFAGGFGEGSKIPGLTGQFTREQGVTGMWADIGRKLGEQQGKEAPQPISTFKSLMEIAKRPAGKPLTPEEEERKKKLSTLFETRQKQGGGFWQADIGE